MELEESGGSSSPSCDEESLIHDEETPNSGVKYYLSD